MIATSYMDIAGNMFVNQLDHIWWVMNEQTHKIEVLRQLGGSLCLDFANTVENRGSSSPEEFLNSYSDLVDWARKVELFPDPVSEYFRDLASRRPRVAATALARARDLRESLHRIFLAIANGDEPDFGDLDHLQQVYASAMSSASLVRQGMGFSWAWGGNELDPDLAIWIIAGAAIDLLATGNLSRIKVCANPDGCGWLFYDQSKNGSRRWCSMESCGSQVKMRALYARKKNQRSIG
jgi:predicted RNA-binding Zn ribbon-like protein